MRAEREERALGHAAHVLERAGLGAPLGVEAEARVHVGEPRDQGEPAQGSRVLEAQQGRGTGLPPAGLRGRAGRGVAVLVHLVAAQEQQGKGSRAQAQAPLAGKGGRAQGVRVAREGVLAERVAGHRSPEPQPALLQRTSRLAAQLQQPIRLVAGEDAGGEGGREVVGLEGSACVAHVGGAREPAGGGAEAQADLHAGRACAHVEAGGAGLQPLERVHVREDRGRPEGGRVGHVEAVEGPEGAPAAVPVGHEQRLLGGLGAAHVHAVHHHSRDIPQDGPGVGRARERAEVLRGEDGGRLGRAIAGNGRRLRRARAATEHDRERARGLDRHLHAAGPPRVGPREQVGPVGAGGQGKEDGLPARVGGGQEREAGRLQADLAADDRPIVVQDRDLQGREAGLGGDAAGQEGEGEGEPERGQGGACTRQALRRR